MNGKVHKETEFKQKILTDLGELESVERRWLAGILAGIIVGAINLTIFLTHLWKILNGQPASLPLVQFVVVVATTAVLLVMSVMAFAEYFSLSLSFRMSVGRGMIIRKRTGRQRSGQEDAEDG
ncbi:MAG: hypothetical protein WB643_06455 [Candidatus Bathyarchaeia archaeon]